MTTRRRLLSASALAVGGAAHGLETEALSSRAAATPATLQIALQDTTSNQVYAFVAGQALNNNDALMLFEADGRTDGRSPPPPLLSRPAPRRGLDRQVI